MFLVVGRFVFLVSPWLRPPMQRIFSGSTRSKNLFCKTKMLLLVKQTHLPSETLVHIDGVGRGGEKREGKLLFIWGEKGCWWKILLNSSHKTGQRGKQGWFKPTRYTQSDKSSDPAAVSWIDKIKEASEKNQSLLKQNELGACDRVGGIMRGEERRRGDIKQEGLLRAGRSRRRRQDNGAIIRRLSEERRRRCVWKKRKGKGGKIDQLQQRLIRGREETGKHAGSTEQTPKRVSPAVTNPQIVIDSRNGGRGPNAPRARPSMLMGGNSICIFLFVAKHHELLEFFFFLMYGSAIQISFYLIRF